MPKINQEEYEVLKELDDKWKWIAGDEAQQTYVYEYRPIKSKLRGQWESNWNDYYPLPHDWFQFIKWEDESPYNIAELIKEYEGEETEVKNIEWLNNEVEKRIKKIKTDEVSFAGSDYFDEGYIHGMRDVQYIANQLDEPEVLSQEWIDEHLFSLGDKYPWKEAVPVVDLQNLLVLEQEKLEAKIQKLIETYKQEEDAYSNPENGWIGGFIEDLKNLVEEEQKYYALIKGHELFNDSEEGYWNVDGKELYIDNAWHDYSGYKTTKLTKDEWTNLGINEDNADFIKVEEMEE